MSDNPLMSVPINGPVKVFKPTPELLAVVAGLNSTLLDKKGRIRLFPAAFYKALPPDALSIWCLQQARYGIPTVELVEWLKNEIGDRKAIEVGAGNGDLGYHLGIVSTDSYAQASRPEMQLTYAATGQVPTAPKPDVLKLSAVDAVKRLKPKVVVASWLTRKFIKGKDKEGVAQAFAYGAEEEKIWENCHTYIHIGNVNSHGKKTLLAKPHLELFFPWLVSRAVDPSRNVIYLWDRYPRVAGLRSELIITDGL